MTFRALRIACLLVVMTCGPATAWAAEEVFVLIPGIAGESTKPGHANWIDAYALSHNSSSSFDGISQSGAPSFSELAVLKPTDRSTPALHDALARGLNVGLVTIEVCGTAVYGPSRCYYKVELFNTRVTSVALSGSASCSSADVCAPAQTESVAFFYTRIKWSYTPPGLPAIFKCWDLATQTTC